MAASTNNNKADPEDATIQAFLKPMRDKTTITMAIATDQQTYPEDNEIITFMRPVNT